MTMTMRMEMLPPTTATLADRIWPEGMKPAPKMRPRRKCSPKRAAERVAYVRDLLKRGKGYRAACLDLLAELEKDLRA